MKKIIILALTLILAVSGIVTVSANSDIKLDFVASSSWNSTQGTDGWYNMYSTTKTVGAYEEMTWGYWANIWKECFAHSIDAGKASVYIANEGLMKPNLGSSVARVWVAPMDGIVNLTSNGGVKKNESKTGGCTVSAKIIKADADDKNAQVLWETSIAGVDNVGTNYDVTVSVKAGQKLYFEIACKDTDANGECRWDPQVEYTRAAYFSVDGSQVASGKDLTENATLEGLFYDKEFMNKNAVIYFALYDEYGTMVDYRNMTVDPTAWDSRKAELSLPIAFGEDSYEGWTAKILVLVLDGNRCYTLIADEPFGIN
jgi:hypothetical protein